MFNLKELINSVSVRKIFKPFSIYTGANFINQLVPFLLLPILTRILSPSDYGILATFMAMIGIVNVIASAGSTDAIIRGYFDKEKKDFDFPKFVFNALVINFAVFLILIVVVAISKSFISQKLSIPANWLFMLPVIGFCIAVSAPSFKLFVFKQKPVPYAILKTFYTLGEILLSVFLVVFLALNWQGRVMGIAINNILFSFIGVYILVRNRYLSMTFNYKHIRQILSFGMPVVIHSLGFTVIAAVDKFFLNSFIGLSATGIYSVGHSISAVIGFLVGSFNLAWSPVFYEKLGQPTEALKVKLVRITYLYFILITFIALGLIFIAPHFLKFFVGKEFFEASRFIFWIALGYAVHGMYTMVAGYIFYQKKTYLLSIIAVITVILSIVFNYTLIKLNGAIGAAQAAFLTFLARFLLIWYFSNKVFPMPWFSFISLKKART